MRAKAAAGMVLITAACGVGLVALAGAGAQEKRDAFAEAKVGGAEAKVGGADPKAGGAATVAPGLVLPTIPTSAAPAAVEKLGGDAAAKLKIGGASSAEGEAAEKYFSNTELVDQNGKPHRFYEDLVRGRKVLINFAFTSCKGVCPGMTANLARVQKLLGARVGKEISILTISVDPVNDTPAVLKQFATKFQAAAGWSFLTGTPENVAAVLKRLGGLAKKPEEHASTLLVGDASSGYWVKTVATARPEDIVYLVDHIADER